MIEIYIICVIVGFTMGLLIAVLEVIKHNKRRKNLAQKLVNEIRELYPEVK